jgi:hypothetical protein
MVTPVSVLAPVEIGLELNLTLGDGRDDGEGDGEGLGDGDSSGEGEIDGDGSDRKRIGGCVCSTLAFEDACWMLASSCRVSP